MSCTETPCTADCTCGCCSGISVATPAGEKNLPGLSAITYRTGTWATFRESMLARLSSTDYPALAYLKTRPRHEVNFTLECSGNTGTGLDFCIGGIGNGCMGGGAISLGRGGTCLLALPAPVGL